MLQSTLLTITHGYLMVWAQSPVLQLSGLQRNAVALALICVVLFLFLACYWYGFQRGRRQAQIEQISDAEERERTLELIHDLGSWTNEYSGKVSQYQNELNALNREVTEHSDCEPSVNNSTANQTSDRIVSLLQQFMQDNGTLQQRLDNAELQLEQKTKQIQQYLNQARTDDLTSLLNRRAFDQRLNELYSHHSRGGRSFSVALIDVDKFKDVNDSHGHQIGDAALKEIAKRLQNSLAKALIVARFGGEEFAVIIDGPLLQSAKMLDRVRHEIETQGQRVGKLHLNSTISVGLSEPHDDTSAAAVLRRADEALYAAKNFGRNRVYYHDGLEPTLVGAPETAQS